MVSIERGIPDWAAAHLDERFLGRFLGTLPQLVAESPGIQVDLFGAHPPVASLIPDCIADGPDCFSLFSVHWPGQGAFAIDALASEGISIALLGADRKPLATADFRHVLSRGALPRQSRALSLEQLPAGDYMLAVQGPPGRFGLSYTSVAAAAPPDAPPSVSEPSPDTARPRQGLTLGLLAFALLLLGALWIARGDPKR